MLKRVMGKASFATLQDSSGRIQIYLERGALGGDDVRGLQAMGHRRHHRDRGSVFQDQQGRAVGACHHRAPAVKSLRPLPDKFHGVADQELRYRQRYVDLIMTDAAPHLRGAQQQAMGSIRQFMLNAGFLEVKRRCCTLSRAAPRPSPSSRITMRWTWKCSAHRARAVPQAPDRGRLRARVRGQPQLPQRRVSPRHNPEFTMMESLRSLADYRWLMDFTGRADPPGRHLGHRQRRAHLSRARADLSKPFDRLTICEAILKYAPGYTQAQLDDAAFVRAELKKLGADADGLVLSRAGLARCSCCSRKPPKPSSGTRPTSSTTRSRFRRWRARPTRARASPSASSCS